MGKIQTEFPLNGIFPRSGMRRDPNKRRGGRRGRNFYQTKNQCEENACLGLRSMEFFLLLLHTDLIVQ